MGTIKTMGDWYQSSDFAKILIATATINYLCNNLSNLTENLQTLARSNPEHLFQLESATECERFLVRTKGKLIEVMEELANFMNNRDAIDETDIHITTPAFDIVYNRSKPE